MSVIQDALKRRLAEQQQGKIARGAPSAGGSAPPPTPPIAQQVLRNDDAARADAAAPIMARPAVAAVPHHADHTGRWILGTALVILFAALVAGVLLYLKQGIPLVAVPPPPDASDVLIPGSTPVAAPTSAAAPVIPGESAASPADPSAQVSATTAPLQGAIPQSQWPEILVDGVMAGAEPLTRSAILNGQMIFLNQKIEGVRLIDVSQTGVRLRYEGQEIDLAIGQLSTDTGE